MHGRSAACMNHACVLVETGEPISVVSLSAVEMNIVCRLSICGLRLQHWAGSGFYAWLYGYGECEEPSATGSRGTHLEHK